MRGSEEERDIFPGPREGLNPAGRDGEFSEQ